MQSQTQKLQQEITTLRWILDTCDESIKDRIQKLIETKTLQLIEIHE